MGYYPKLSRKVSSSSSRDRGAMHVSPDIPTHTLGRAFPMLTIDVGCVQANRSDSQAEFTLCTPAATKPSLASMFNSHFGSIFLLDLYGLALTMAHHSCIHPRFLFSAHSRSMKRLEFNASQIIHQSILNNNVILRGSSIVAR